ncbi:MAG: hypothetical protein J6Z14_10445 [Prevotella sp.]|nr:hypothetical protein [Prevotella sp.]
MMKRNLLLVSLLLLAGLMPVSAENITVGGTTRNYIVYAPKNLGENRPLLISCHGMNQDANYQKGMLVIESVADTAKFLTVFPNGIDKSWDISGDRDINFVKALIDAMVTKYKIDRNRVYLSGFSMGGMFTYHAMNKIPDLIAAFAPISGYSMWGTTANANVRPLPIIHTHGTDDDVVSFSGVQGALNVWINHNGCPTQPKVEKNYRGAAHITRRTWGPGNNGVEVVLMEMAGKGHWISNDNGVKTGDEIWRFCKRFSLNMQEPTVRFTSPQNDLTYVTLGGQSQIDPIAVSVDASLPSNADSGSKLKVAFYNDDNLIVTKTSAPYTCTVRGLKKGNHKIKAVATATKSDGSMLGTATAELAISVQEPTGSYVFTKVFSTVGSVPEGWATSDGVEQRVGYSDGYSSGCRVFQFTGTAHDFEWGLYARNVEGKTGAGYARFADPQTTTVLTLHEGNYQLMHRLANWNQSSFSPVRVTIEHLDGTVVYEETVTPTVNIGNSAENAFSGATLCKSFFDVYETAPYQITFYTADQPWADLVVGQAAVMYKGVVTSVPSVVDHSPLNLDQSVYDLQGRRVDAANGLKGIYIKNGKKIAY